jgi:hypothetical protein
MFSKCCTAMYYFNFCAETAARHGHLATLKWLVEIGVDYKHYEAAHGGHIEVLRWLHEHKYLRPCAYLSAARQGQLETLRWLRENGVDWNSINVCEEAVVGGHLEILRWARENGAGWDDKVFATAVYGGHLEILRWLRSQKAPWNQIECKAIAIDQLRMLHWARKARENNSLDVAREQAFLDVLRWVSETDPD